MQGSHAQRSDVQAWLCLPFIVFVARRRAAIGDASRHPALRPSREQERPMVQSAFVPESKQAATAVVVSGGKQYRVSAGDQVLVGRVKAEVGSELVFDRVLLHVDGDQVKVGTPGIEGLTVTARVLQHSRGPRIEVLRYKSKKRVRVHKGARADYTSIEILAVGDQKAEKAEKAKPAKAAKAKAGKAAVEEEATDGA
jgi:large subunit ribosomal protein L21